MTENSTNGNWEQHQSEEQFAPGIEPPRDEKPEGEPGGAVTDALSAPLADNDGDGLPQFQFRRRMS